MARITVLSLGENPIQHLALTAAERAHARALVFPSIRSIRHFRRMCLSLNEGRTVISPYCFQVDDFIRECLRPDGLVLVGQEQRVLYLQKALRNVERGRLRSIFAGHSDDFCDNFMHFASTGSRLLRFFEELCAEQVSLDTLGKATAYTDYEAHISILREIAELYRVELEAAGLIDPMFLKLAGSVDVGWLDQFEQVHFLVGGYLTNFELGLLKTVSEVKPLEIIVRHEGVPDRQTGKIFSFFDAVPATVSEHAMPDVTEIRAFDNAVEQYGFIVGAIERALRAGFAPEDIVVVLPDARMKRILIGLDRNRIFSFAMGLDFKDTLLYSFLLTCGRLIKDKIGPEEYRREHVVEFLQHPFVRNRAGQIVPAHETLRSVKRGSRLKLLADEFCQGEGIRRVFQSVREVLSMRAAYPAFLLSLVQFVDDALGHLDKDFAVSIYRSPEFSESRRALREYLLESAAMPWEPFAGEDDPLVHMEYLMRQFEDLSYNDIAGGGVTVMGMLETRHIPFRVVIIPDMNEDFIPPRSEKDLFLNSEVRQFLGIPDYSDRESLVRSYFMSLVKNASMAFLGYVDRDDRGIRSRFIEEIMVRRGHGSEDPSWLRQTEHFRGLTFALAPREARHRLHDAVPAGENDMRRIQGMTLTPTMLKTFRECQYRFFLLHVKRLREPREPRRELGASDIGIIVHEALRNVYSGSVRFTDASELHSALRAEVQGIASAEYDAVGLNPQARFELDMVTERMGVFAEREMERFEQGWTPRYLEYELYHDLAGFRLAGRADRVDVRKAETGPEIAFIIDYKFSTVGRQRSFRYDRQFLEFQLPLYRMMLQSRHPNLVIEGFGYYDLKSKCELVRIVEEDPEEKFGALLGEILAGFKVSAREFVKTEDVKLCATCEFVRICGRMRR